MIAAVHVAFMASSQIKFMGQDNFADQPPSTPANFVASESSSSTTSTTSYSPLSLSSSSSFSLIDRATEAVLGTTKSSSSSRSLKWAIFTPPKPFSKAPHQLVALRSWLDLRIPPKVFLVEADDLDPGELAEIRAEYNVESFPGATNAKGFLLQNALFERASKEQDLDVVVVINSDIILGDDFLEALQHVEATFDRFLMVGARYDNLTPQEIPQGADREWIKAFMEQTWEEGALHTYGGSDYFAWRPVGDPAMAATGGRIPPFTYGRGKADNWIIDAALKNGVVEVIDATTAILAVHVAHGYDQLEAAAMGAAAAAVADGEVVVNEEQVEVAGESSSTKLSSQFPPSGNNSVKETEGQRSAQPGAAVPASTGTTAQKHRHTVTVPDADPASVVAVNTTADAVISNPAPAPGKYVNYWSAKVAGEPQSDLNKYLAYNFGSFQNGDGTPLHAPWQLMRCVEADMRAGGGGHGGYIEKPCLRYRTRPGACPCEHSSMVPKTLTDVESQGNVKLCGKAPKMLRESFGEEFAFENLMAQQARDGTLVLIGFNYGYQDMLLNMVCRLQQLEVPNYVIAAFDAEAMAFCRTQVLPCFPVNAEIAVKAEAIVMGQGEEKVEAAVAAAARPEAAGHVNLQAAAHAFGTKGFRALTKLKSQQVLRILELGYNVFWSDVDIFWKVNVVPGVLAEMGEGKGSVDIAIQSNAPPEEEAENGKRRINSGFYLAKSNPQVVEAFRQIVAHARESALSEQPSFYTVLCGDDLEYVQGKSNCVNTAIPVKTLLLSRETYPNGAMVEVVRGVTPASEDDVRIVHFNWLEGHDAKVESFVNASMWLLQEDDMTCKTQVGGREGGRGRGMKAGKEMPRPTVTLPEVVEKTPPTVFLRRS